MKTIVKTFALALSFGLISATASLADTNPITRPVAAAVYQKSVFATQTGDLRISLDKDKGSAVDIRLKNQDGDVLYSQHLNKRAQNYRSKLTLNDLPDGIYRLEIQSGSSIEVQTIDLSSHQPTAPSRVVAIK